MQVQRILARDRSSSVGDEFGVQVRQADPAPADLDVALMSELMSELYLDDGSADRYTMYRLYHLATVRPRVLPRDEFENLARRVGFRFLTVPGLLAPAAPSADRPVSTP